MGSASLQQQIGTPIENNLVALVITNQTDRVITKVEAEPSKYFLTQPINFRGDTLLHYACGKNNAKLVDYLIKKNPELLLKQNNSNQLPVDMASNSIIKATCNNKMAQLKKK